MMLPMLRLIAALLLCLGCWSWVLRTCVQYQINYLDVFGFPYTQSVTWHEILELSSLTSFGLVITIIVTFYVSSPWFEYVVPLFVLFLLILLLVPPKQTQRRARSALFSVLQRCVCLPFTRKIQFVDFFVADWCCSLAVPLMDVLYVFCYYFIHRPFSSSGQRTMSQIMLNPHIGQWHPHESTSHRLVHHVHRDACRCNDAAERYYFVLALVPFAWRAAQTAKMYITTKNKVHIVNHFKYQSFIMDFSIKLVYALYPSSSLLLKMSWASHIFSEFYGLCWDILMDWGFIRGRSRALLLQSPWIYWMAGAFDFAGRFCFIPAELWLKPNMSGPELLALQGGIEIIRRTVWSLFRLENENVSNLEAYRMPTPSSPSSDLRDPIDASFGSEAS